MMSEAFSAIIRTQALICADTRSGMTEASTTRRCSTPRTRRSGSVTVSGVVPMAQVFARYAKDILEQQYYPEVRRAPNAPAEAPYDVSAWSLGMLLGVDHVVIKNPLAQNVALQKLTDAPARPGSITGNGTRFAFD